jgi:hypothetical protein
MTCQHCGTQLKGDFICINFGGLLKGKDDSASMSNKVEHFLTISCHSDTLENYDSVFLEDKFQYQCPGQAESYFCTKKCLLEWFTRQMDKIPEPR